MGDKSDILVVIAHPDDEVFASGTICLCAEEGFRIEFVCATDGEGENAISYFQQAGHSPGRNPSPGTDAFGQDIGSERGMFSGPTGRRHPRCRGEGS